MKKPKPKNEKPKTKKIVKPKTKNQKIAKRKTKNSKTKNIKNRRARPSYFAISGTSHIIVQCIVGRVVVKG